MHIVSECILNEDCGNIRIIAEQAAEIARLRADLARMTEDRDAWRHSAFLSECALVEACGD